MCVCVCVCVCVCSYSYLAQQSSTENADSMITIRKTIIKHKPLSIQRIMYVLNKADST